MHLYIHFHIKGLKKHTFILKQERIVSTNSVFALPCCLFHSSVLTRFHKMNPMVRFLLSSESLILPRFYILPPLKEFRPEIQTHICQAPIPGPTRLADPNRFPGRETQDWDSLPDFFFIELTSVGMAHI